MTRLAALVVLVAVVVAACGGGAAPATTSAFSGDARRYAADADRALDGTRFADVPAADLAAALDAICAGTGPLPAAIEAAIAGFGAPAEPPGDGIMAEVLVAGIAQVCPQRAAADLSAAFLASVAVTIDQEGGAPVADDIALTAGLSVCATLDRGTPQDAVLTAAAALYGIETGAEGTVTATPEQGVGIGAVIASAVAYLCPEHRDRVAAFVDGLGEG